MDDRGVVPTPKRCPDLDQLKTQQLTHQVHRNLARCGECLGPCLGTQTLGGHPPFLGNHLLDRLEIEASTRCPSCFAWTKLVAKRFAGDIDRDLTMLQGSIGEKLDDGSLEL